MNLKLKKSLLKVAYYTLKKFLEPAESYLIMNNSMVNKNYISQLGEKICTFGQKIMIFKKWFIKYEQKTQVDSNLWSAVHNLIF